MLVLVGILYFLGSYHVVSSSDGGTSIIPKVCFSFSEALVSVDQITGMPFIMAKAKYPLSVKALQKEGILETDEQFRERVDRETEQEMRDSMEKTRRELGY